MWRINSGKKGWNGNKWQILADFVILFTQNSLFISFSLFGNKLKIQSEAKEKNLPNTAFENDEQADTVEPPLSDTP